MAWNRPAYSRANWQETCTKTEDWRRRSAYNRPWSSILSPDQAARLAMKNVLSVILGGGRGTRLYPLTALRSKPAVPVAGKYRLIDIPISNCINSGFNRIYVLTQFLSVSLHRHIANTYKFDPFSKGFVEVLAAQQTNETADWYQGTADAVRQQHPLCLGGSAPRRS